MGGLGAGKTLLSGLMPTGGMPGGAAPPTDRLQGKFKAAEAVLKDLATSLMGGDLESAKEAHSCSDYANKLQGMAIARATRFAKAPMSGGQQNSGQVAMPANVNGGGISRGY